MKFRQKLFARLYRDPEPGVDGSGDSTIDTSVDTSAANTAADTAPPANSIEGGMAAMFPVAAPEGETAEAKAERLRDAAGRFATKTEPDPKAAATDPNAVKKPVVDPKDATVMPEGLTPKAAERFQTLANTNKELTGRLEQLTAVAGGNPDAIAPMLQNAAALQQTFQEHGVTREQFTQATQAIGLLNRGDIAGFQSMLEDQLRQISLVTGKAPGQIDPLAGFPDLRERVDALQISESDAIELARNRTVQNNQQQTQQRQQQDRQIEQQSQQAIHGGQVAVDRFCKSRMTSDLDYAKIEPLLLKEVQGGLLEGIPPQRWAAIIEKTYNLIKQTAGSVRTQTTGGSGGGVLRPSGGDAVKGKPQSGFEAMFGTPAPAGYRE